MKLNTNYSVVYSSKNNSVTLNFTHNCQIDHSKFQCADGGHANSYSSISFDSNSITCPSSNLNGIKNQLYITWGSNQRISTNSTNYKVFEQYLNHLNGSNGGYAGENTTIRIKMEVGVAKEIHHLIECFNTLNYFTTVKTYSDDEISCIIPLNDHEILHSGDAVGLKIINSSDVFSRFPLYVYAFSNCFTIEY